MLLAQKLKNRFKQTDPNYLDLKFYLENININGSKRGCSGFIQNIKNGRIVYINTEKSVYTPLNKLNLYRKAENLKDFTGGINHFSSDDHLVDDVLTMLKMEEKSWIRGYSI